MYWEQPWHNSSKYSENGQTKYIIAANVDAVVNFLSQVIFVFVLFLGMVMYASEVETKEKQK